MRYVYSKPQIIFNIKIKIMENQSNIQSETKQSNSGLKAVIAILALLLVGSLGYIYKITNDSKLTETKLLSEKELVLKDLGDAKDSLNIAISSNSTLSDELLLERDRVEKLIVEVEKAQEGAASMQKYKVEAGRLKNNVNKLMKEVAVLKKQNELLVMERDSTSTALGDSKRLNDTLSLQNNKLATVVEKASKLTVLNLQSSAIRQKSSGKQISTDKASKADVLKISFMIAENQVAKSGDKNYYVQIIDPKNNILGDKKTENFSDKSVTYSFVSAVKYENKTVQVSKDLPVQDIAEGLYVVNIFDKAELVSKTTFTLR